MASRKYWAGQRVHWGFSITSYRKTWTNSPVNPVCVPLGNSDNRNINQVHKASSSPVNLMSCDPKHFEVGGLHTTFLNSVSPLLVATGWLNLGMRGWFQWKTWVITQSNGGSKIPFWLGWAWKFVINAKKFVLQN